MRTARAGVALTHLATLEAEAIHVIREVDSYAETRGTGAFVLIDEGTNDTVAAGMVEA